MFFYYIVTHDYKERHLHVHYTCFPYDKKRKIEKILKGVEVTWARIMIHLVNRQDLTDIAKIFLQGELFCTLEPKLIDKFPEGYKLYLKKY